ncbi:MAG: cytochrome c3 family protein [bacterium]|nr:cytochrome c3 family protein [bacterium]
MAQIFPRWVNSIPLVLAAVALVGAASVVGFFWYYGSPKYTDVGYRPTQPVPYSHKTHAGDLGIDCRYCHVGVESQAVASVPPTQTCMNCHTLVLPESDSLTLVRQSWSTNEPIEWVRIHNLPDFVYFDHSIHINRGVGCITCHGNVAQMIEVQQDKPLSMSWCLDCHKNPGPELRPTNQVTNMKWEKGEDHKTFSSRVIEEKSINPPIECSGCHR